MEKGRSVTLKHLLIKERRYIGLQFNTDKVIHALVRQLPDVKWSNSSNMAYILNTKQNLDELFKIFNGVVWVNCNHFFDKSITKENNQPIDITWFRKRELPATYRVCAIS
jgi:integrase/recombinase XerD